MEPQEIIVRQIAENAVEPRQVSIEIAADKDRKPKPTVKLYLQPLVSDEAEAAADAEGERVVRVCKKLMAKMVAEGLLVEDK